MNRIVTSIQKRLFLPFLLALSFNLVASKEIQVSLLTCGTAKPMYALFGHSALRIQYPSGKDLVFNFGTFDFDTPHFALSFAKGSLQYCLDVEQFSSFLHEYQSENREVREQKLALSTEEKSILLKDLEFLYKKENRYYSYRFLHNNCSSKLRDLLLHCTKIEKADLEQSSGYTYRELLSPYLQGWNAVLINLILGSRVDREVSRYEEMFLPYNLSTEVSKLHVGNRALVEQETKLYPSTATQKTSFWVRNSPMGCVVILLLVYLLSFGKKYHDAYKTCIFILIGIIGLLVGALSLFSEHPELKMNLHLLWCNPLFLLYPALRKSSLRKAKEILENLLKLSLFSSWGIWIAGMQKPENVYVFFSIFLFFLLSSSNFLPQLQRRKTDKRETSAKLR